MITPENIKENRERFLQLLRDTNREGIENVIKFLEENDFFEMPSSINRHHNWEGGLTQHCLGVLDRLNETGPELERDNRIITSLLHDVCKAGKIYKDSDGQWKEKDEEELDIPGHGERSVKLLENLGLQLTPPEKQAIKWHMGGWKIGDKAKEEIRDFYSTKRMDLWRLLHNADRYDASHNDPRIKRNEQ